MRFIRLSQENARAMADLESLCFSLPWTHGQCEGALGQDSFAAFGICRESELIAYISFFHTAGEMEIINVGVRPGWRRKGLGSKIMRLVLQAAVKMGMQQAVLEVRQSNLPAIGLYEKMGFYCCGKRAKYYPDNGEDALVYMLIFDKEAI